VLGGLALCAASARAEPVTMTALTPTQVVRDTATSSSEIAALAAELGGSDVNRRRRAFSELTRLNEDALDAIAGRVTALSRKRPPLDRTLTNMTEFRKVQGFNRADDPVDLAAGILKVLSRRRSKWVVATAEPLLLLRSLESIGTPAAARVALDIFGLEDKAWRWEAQRTLQRFGAAMLPAMVAAETKHEKAWVRRFCRWGVDRLKLRKPGRAVQDQDVAVLAALLRAYGETLRFDAMPVVVSYVGDSRVQVRNAARWTLEQYGRNAIWQIREAYLNATGKDADPSWGTKRALAELYGFHDSPRREMLQKALEQSRSALLANDEKGAREALDAALRRSPTGEAAREAAPAYADLGARALSRDDLRRSAADYTRALRLDASHAEAARWRAQLAFIEGEQRLSAGFVDLPSYARANQLDPEHDQASAILDVLSGNARDREDTTRRVVAWLAALLLSLAGLALLRRSGPSPDTDTHSDADSDGNGPAPTTPAA